MTFTADNNIGLKRKKLELIGRVKRWREIENVSTIFNMDLIPNQSINA